MWQSYSISISYKLINLLSFKTIYSTSSFLSYVCFENIHKSDHKASAVELLFYIFCCDTKYVRHAQVIFQTIIDIWMSTSLYLLYICNSNREITDLLIFYMAFTNNCSSFSFFSFFWWKFYCFWLICYWIHHVNLRRSCLVRLSKKRIKMSLIAQPA